MPVKMRWRRVASIRRLSPPHACYKADRVLWGYVADRALGLDQLAARATATDIPEPQCAWAGAFDAQWAAWAGWGACERDIGHARIKSRDRSEPA